MVTDFHRRLEQACREKNSRVCVGIDPRLELLPAELRSPGAPDAGESAAAFLAFGLAVLEAVEPYTAVVKPQSAFFEALGHEGVRVLEELCVAAQDRGLLVIGDLKRGDIGSTAEAYAQAAFREIGGRPLLDAVTVNPYLGSDGIRPFVKTAREKGGGVFVLCKTSNPSSVELQDLEVETGPVHEHMAGLIARWNAETPGVLGAVVGGTQPEALGRLRKMMPGLPFLIPGVGAQGGRLEDVVVGFEAAGGSAVVNSSRGITFPWAPASAAPQDWRERIRVAARDARDDLRSALASR